MKWEQQSSDEIYSPFSFPPSSVSPNARSPAATGLFPSNQYLHDNVPARPNCNTLMDCQTPVSAVAETWSCQRENRFTALPSLDKPPPAPTSSPPPFFPAFLPRFVGRGGSSSSSLALVLEPPPGVPFPFPPFCAAKTLSQLRPFAW